MKFLGQQYSERDGVRRKFFAGCFGIFGHGNVAGLGQALLQSELLTPGRVALSPGPQRAGDGAHRRRLRPAARPAAGLRGHRVRRSGRQQHAHRRGAGDHQPAAGAAAAQRHLRHPGLLAGAAGAGTAVRVRHLGQRRVPAGVPVLRPGVAGRAVAGGAAGRDAGADRPRRDRCGDHRAAGGRAGRGARLAGRPVQGAGLADRPAGPRARGAGRGRRDHPRRQQAGDHLRWRRHLRRGQRRAEGVRRGHRHPDHRDPGRQGLAAVRSPAEPGRGRCHR